MANMINNYGLDFISEDEEVFAGFVGYVTQEGRALTGYYETPYILKTMGDIEFVVNTEKDDKGRFSVAGFNTHCGNECVWELTHSGIDITPKDALKTERVIIFNKKDKNSGVLPIEIIKADVLPSFLKGDKIAMQVVGMPIDIKYYANEDEYAKMQPSNENGEKWLIANGSMIAVSFLYNHSPERYQQGKDYQSDRYVQFVATVKALYHGTFEMQDEEHNTFIRCIVETEYGKIELDHTLEQVSEEFRDNIKVGAVVAGTCVISGDVAINEYTKGIVKDFEHNLKLLRHTFVKGEVERLASVLSESVIFEDDIRMERYTGKQEVVRKINNIYNAYDKTVIAYNAKLASVDMDNPEYETGTKCIVLAKEESKYKAIVFVSVNDDGLITKIKMSRDNRYKFIIDKVQKS